MRAKILILCGQCNWALESINIDTADMPDQLQQRINKPILEHRAKCSYYATPPVCQICAIQLQPAPARFDGVPTCVGYLPCPVHPKARAIYDGSE